MIRVVFQPFQNLPDLRVQLTRPRDIGLIGDVGDRRVPNLCQLAYCAAVILEKRLRHPVRLPFRLAQRHECIARAAHSAVKGFADDVIRACPVELVDMVPVARARHDVQIRALASRKFHQPDRLLGVVNRADEHFRPFKPCCVQQIDPCRVSEKGFHAKGAQAVDQVGLMIKHHSVEALGKQHPVHDLTEAPLACDDHRAAFIDLIHLLGLLVWRLGEEAFMGNEKRRGQQHRKRHHQGKLCDQVRLQHMGREREAEQHEAELACLGQAQREEPALRGGQLEDACDHEKHQRFDRNQAKREAHELIAAVLARQGVAAEDANAYLAPSIRDLMPDPMSLRDMGPAAERIVQAALAKERVAIFADYDVDGGASAALLIDWYRQLGVTPTLYVPDRIDEGYGPNEPAMAGLAAEHDLIICVDCGTLSHEPIAAANAADVLVLDHHLGGETLPPALAVVNPNRQDEDGALWYLCAAGVVFLALAAANKLLREKSQPTPDLLQMLDLVALATVADVASLTGFNRALVRQGLAIMAQRRRPGLVALADRAGIRSTPGGYHLGYVMGPRVNAGGRIGAADLGAKLLSTTEPHEAEAMAERLEGLNAERRSIEARVLEEATAQVEARGKTGPLVWAAGDGWHPDVVGIVASRLKEATNRPAIVIGLDGAEGKGSGRSVSGIDLGSAVAACAREGVLLKGGGHKMAAGLTVAADGLEPAMARLSELLEKQGAGRLGPRDMRIDSMIGARALSVDAVEKLEAAGPFGAGSPAPRVALADARITFAKRAGDAHLRLTLEGPDGGRVDAIAFRAFESPLGEALENHAGQLFHIAGRLELDDWGGRRKVKLTLEDAAPA